MMLMLRHEGWTVLTNAWTAASKDGKSVEVCYQWGPDRVSWLDSAVSTARVTLDISMATFSKMIEAAGGSPVNLVHWCPRD